MSRPSVWRMIREIGPGIAVAATGVGAADLVSSSVAGSRYGMTLAWAIVIGAGLKFVLNEGVARWHLATGSSVVQGWARHWGMTWLFAFLGYLIVWSIVVCGGLMVAAGLAANSVFPGLSREAWGAIQGLLALALVWLGSYDAFERLMKIMIAVMFVTIVGSAVVAGFSSTQPLAFPAISAGSLPLSLALIGGVGGSVTMLIYGYWMEQKQWTTPSSLTMVRVDLAVAYGLTGLVAIGVMLLASEILLPKGVRVEGQQGLIVMASVLQQSFGDAGKWIFLVGFWAAAFSSLIGVLQGAPYLFADLMHCWRSNNEEQFDYSSAARSTNYRVFLVGVALLGMLLLFYDKPILIVVIYAVLSSLFMPILTVALLIMNNRAALVGDEYRNGWLTNVSLILAIGLFFNLAIVAVVQQFTTVAG